MDSVLKTTVTFGEKWIRVFQQKLLVWYALEGRDLPWRHTQNPYHILVSELMLHQTQVNRVIPKYREWLRIYPTIEDLASAPLDEVKKLWRPLGYNFRPERLHQIAQFIVNKLNGKLPNTLEELMTLRGIGRYTAGAILSFAYRKDAPIVDTNVRRLIKRLFGIQSNPMCSSTKKQIWEIAEALIPPGKAYIFNQALLDFGALICTARNPNCSACFIQNRCLWRST
jgi:A/G-specific adenine glycosylase